MHSCQVQTVSAAHVAQLSSPDCVCSPVLLVKYSRSLWSASGATVVSRGGKPAHKKLCKLASYAYWHWIIHLALRAQHCCKSEYLKPRSTTYDSSCRDAPDRFHQVSLLSTHDIHRGCAMAHAALLGSELSE